MPEQPSQQVSNQEEQVNPQNPSQQVSNQEEQVNPQVDHVHEKSRNRGANNSELQTPPISEITAHQCRLDGEDSGRLSLIFYTDHEGVSFFDDDSDKCKVAVLCGEKQVHLAEWMFVLLRNIYNQRARAGRINYLQYHLHAPTEQEREELLDTLNKQLLNLLTDRNIEETVEGGRYEVQPGYLDVISDRLHTGGHYRVDHMQDPVSYGEDGLIRRDRISIWIPHTILSRYGFST